MRPFEGIRVIDVTHVLAGPFATYQFAVLGADEIKVEHPDDPDQSRGTGTDKALNRRNMGTGFLTQASNKRSITLDLKDAGDREILKKLVATALFQRERTGRGQRIDMAMLDVAMVLMGSHVTGYLRNGVHPKPHGNRHPHATNGAFETKDGLVMLGASNLRQQRRLWTVLGRPDMIKRTNDERDADHDREIAVLSELMLTRTADEWEEFLQARHVPAARVRTMGEALADPQLATRGVVHRHAAATGVEGGFGVPLAAFTFAHGGPRIDSAPPKLGQHNEEILAELGRERRQARAG